MKKEGTAYRTYWMAPVLQFYVMTSRMDRALLLSGTNSVTEVAGKTGFDSATYFSKLFRQAFGVTPLQMKKNYWAESL